MTSTTAIPTITAHEVVEGYLECWNATDAAARAVAIARTWTEDATSSDPLAEVSGHEGLAAMMTAVGEQYPGHTFRRVGEIDSHHDLLRWTWEMVDAEGTKVIDGIDVAVRADDGRLSHLAGFFGATSPDAAG